MRLAILTGLAVFAAGCTFGVTECTTNEDCMVGTCVSNFCVMPDGSAGGGGGGGGAVTGGGAGGGGGGTTAMCMPACGEGKSCQQNAGRPECQALRVELLSPDAGTYLGGETVQVVATVKNADGTGWEGGSVPLKTMPDLGSFSLMRTPTGRYEGGVALPLTAGMLTLTAGWPGAEASVTVATEACTSQQAASCAAWEACVPTATGGTCENTSPVLTWAAPDAGMRVPGGVALPLKVQVAVTPTTKGATVYPASVPVVRVDSNVNVLLTRAMNGPPGAYEGAIDPGMTEGNITLTAGWPGDAGPQKSVSVYVDVLPPEVGLFAAGGPLYIRDSLVVAALTSNEALSDAGVTLAGVPMERRPVADCAALDGGRGVVDCFALDFSKPALNALNGGFDALLTATDMFGHTVSGADGGKHLVTRVRWTSCPAGCNGSTNVTGLAVNLDGGLLVGVSRSLTTGAVALVSPGDGGTARSWESGSVQSLAAHGEVAYVAMNEEDGGRIGGFSAGGLFSSCSGAGPSYSGIALLRHSSGAVGAVGSMNSTSSTAPDGLGCVYYPSRQALPFNPDSNLLDSYAVAASSTPSAAVNVVIARTAGSSPMASFLSQRGGFAAQWQPVSGFLSSGSAGTARAITSGPLVPPLGQALLADGGVLIGSGESALVGQWDGVLASSTLVSSGALGATAPVVGSPVVAATGEAYVGRGFGLVRFDPSSLNSSTVVVSGTVGSENFYLSPVLTSATDGGVGSGYAVGSGGSLFVFGQGDGGLQWQAALGAGVATHPTFDCNRQSPNTKTGILYVGRRGGSVQAIIVDSPRLLDTPGAWPKYQRSMGNAGNDDLTNFPTNWPGCP